MTLTDPADPYEWRDHRATWGDLGASLVLILVLAGTALLL